MLLCASTCLSSLAQSPVQAPIVSTTTKEVVVDVVVRDKHGHLVTDLQPGDFQVYEDGARQKITSFQNIQGPQQIAAEQPAAEASQPPAQAASPRNTLREFNFVTIVVGDIAPENLSFARNALREFFKNELRPKTYIAVLRADNTLRLLQPFTDKHDVLLRAADNATKLHSAGSSQATNNALATQTLTAAANAPTGPGANPVVQPPFSPNDSTFQRYAGSLDASTSTGVAQMAEATLAARLRLVGGYVNGMTAMDMLRELVHAQAHLPGRKVTLYLSDGLQLPPDRPDSFAGVLSDANRAGVTFYTLDTQGLSVQSPLAGSVAQLNRATSESNLGRALQNGSLSKADAFDAASASEDVQLLASSSPQLALQELAVRTGGFATANTNDINGPMRRVMEDIATHYELAYTPSSDVYNGAFRKIEVKVDRPKVTIQSRRGYFALPELNGEPIQPFELGALNAINARPQPRAVPFQAELLKFRPYQGGIECAVTFEVPLAGLTLQPNRKPGISHVEISLMGLIQDSNGQIVHRVSRELVREIPTAQWPAAQQQSITYSEPVALMPGRYVLSTAVVDDSGGASGAQKSGAKRLSEFISPLGPLSLSSIELVQRVDPLTTPANPLDPFEMQGKRLTFTLRDTLPAGKPAPLYFVIYPGQDAGSAPPKVFFQLFKDGKEVARISPQVSKPDATGAIPVYAELSPPPGSYDLRVTVTQGEYTAQSSRLLTIQ